MAKRYREDRDIENEAANYRAAVITAAVMNTVPRPSSQRIFQPWDIFPCYNWRPQQTMTPDQLLQVYQSRSDVDIVELN